MSVCLFESLVISCPVFAFSVALIRKPDHDTNQCTHDLTELKFALRHGHHHRYDTRCVIQPTVLAAYPLIA